MNVQFNNPITTADRLSFARFQAKQDKDKPGFYAGVLIIEKGSAKGHYAVKEESGRVVNFDGNNPEHGKLQKYPIQIGDVTLDDVLRCGNESDNVKCKLDHGATVRDIVGDYAGFRRDGDQVRADLALMESTPHRAYVEEIISKYSKKIGNSIDFDYVYDIKGNVAVARCVKLNSVDIVDAPAATNSLFQEQQLNQPEHMPLTAEDMTLIRGAFKEEITTQLGAVEAKFKTRFDEIKTKLEEGEETDDDKKKKEEAKKDDDTKLSTLVKTAALAAVREVLPKATLENLATLGQNNQQKDPYEEKLQLAKAAGMSETQATYHISRKFPDIYNAKFGAGEASKKATL